MNDVVAGEAQAEGPSAGTLLRRAREATGMHVATLAVSLKVPPRKIEALEEDRYDLLGDAVFVRALASSVCRTLKIDPQPVLGRLPQGAKPRLVHAGDGINAPFRAPGDGPAPGILDRITRPAALTVVALLLAALVILFLPAVQREDAAAARPKAAPPAASVTSPPAAVTPAQPAPTEQVADQATLKLAASAAAPTLTPSPTAAATPPASAAVVTQAPVAAPASAPDAVAATPQSAASGVVVFRTRAASWVHVTDAKGTTVFRKMMDKGETAGVSAPPPLMVTVGSAPSTDVLVRGKAFDLAPVTRDNVARFEVK